jgi:hypothetical protein
MLREKGWTVAENGYDWVCPVCSKKKEIQADKKEPMLRSRMEEVRVEIHNAVFESCCRVRLGMGCITATCDGANVESAFSRAMASLDEQVQAYVVLVKEEKHFNLEPDVKAARKRLCESLVLISRLQIITGAASVETTAAKKETV